jgi:preprotein translocase subunit SecG
MYSFFVIIFIITCILLVVVILLQAGKGQGLAGSFGGIGGGAVFGGRGAATFLSKTTAVLAIIYGLLCITIGYIYRTDIEQTKQSIIQRQAEEQSQLPATDLREAPLRIPMQGDSLD